MELENSEKCKIQVFCENCNFDGEIEIPKEALAENHPCPECGSKALVNKSNHARFVPHLKDDF